MARCLIVACGCRGEALGLALRSQGHAIRATSRSAARVAQLTALGFDARVADPDRIMTLSGALEHVGVLVVLLGSAAGSAEDVAALHEGRLEMLLLCALDSTVRGIVYEAAGSVPAEVLSAGRERVRAFCDGSRIPWAAVTAEPGDHPAWLAEATGAVARVLGG